MDVHLRLPQGDSEKTLIERADLQTNSFTLTIRVRSFDSSENLRIITNTTGTCRIEVFDARVTYINCNSIADNSSTRFLGLEQF